MCIARDSSVISVGRRALGEDGHVLVVAEAGINHNGSLDKAVEMIHAAAECGADAIKFQTFQAATFISDAEAVFEYRTAAGSVREKSLEMFKRVELDYSWHERLFDEARKAGILVFSTPCDEKAVDLLASLNTPMFKISSDYLTYHEFIRYVAAQNRPMIVSTGMATLGDIEEAITAVESTGNRQLILLHCVSAYPTPLDQVNLRAMDTLKRTFGLPVGFSDHTEGVSIALAAAALGAVLVEKHFTLSKRDVRGPDHWFSADPEGLKSLVSGIRDICKALGSPVKRVVPCEQHSRLRARMSLVASVDIPAGTPITRQMLSIKRPGTGIPPKEIEGILGQVALQNLPKDQVLRFDQIGRPLGSIEGGKSLS